MSWKDLATLRSKLGMEKYNARITAENINKTLLLLDKFVPTDMPKTGYIYEAYISESDTNPYVTSVFMEAKDAIEWSEYVTSMHFPNMNAKEQASKCTLTIKKIEHCENPWYNMAATWTGPPDSTQLDTFKNLYSIVKQAHIDSLPKKTYPSSRSSSSNNDSSDGSSDGLCHHQNSNECDCSESE